MDKVSMESHNQRVQRIRIKRVSLTPVFGNDDEKLLRGELWNGKKQ